MKKDITIKEIQRFENYYDKIKNEELSTNLKELLLNNQVVYNFAPTRLENK